MPVFSLNQELIFPPPYLANPDGILAVGGDLRPERLLLAYEMGIFPWYSGNEPIIWWSPDPRFILRSGNLKVPKSMRPVLNKKKFHITYDQAFSEVIANCQQTPRKGQRGTWITAEMREAYIQLHKMGYAHSVEVWQEENLAGGLYGVSLGNCFFGESMFAHVSNASKAGFITLIQQLHHHGFDLIDCQVYTDHLSQFGAIEVARDYFLNILAQGLKNTSLIGNWGNIFNRK